MKRSRSALFRLKSATAVFLLALGAILQIQPAVHAIPDALPNRYLLLSDSVISKTNVAFALSFEILTPGTLGSVEVEFCDNDPFPGEPCVSANGTSVSGVTLVSQAGPGDFSIDTGNSTASKIILSRTPSAVGATPITFDFNGMTNPSVAGTYYVRLRTFATDDATGPQTDKGGIALAIVHAINVTTEVPPRLDFCVGLTIASSDCSDVQGNFVDLGELSPTKTLTATSQFVVGTNAPFGYNVTSGGTTLTAGNEEVTALTNQAPSLPGEAQFGINLRANTFPLVGEDPSGFGVGVPTSEYNNPNQFRFRPNDTLVTYNDSENFRKFTVSYIVNIPKQQAPGVYATTVSYICLGNF